MPSKRVQLSIKHAIDCAVASIALVLLAPLLMLIAVLIFLDTGRPILFRQTRVGYRGQRFKVYKFRTMIQNADLLLEDENAGQASRITRVGRFLRLTSLDEIPQLINVLLGQMSIVGPRPGTEERHERFSTFQKRRCEMRPGITGLAQVSGRNTLPWSRRAELDVQYIDNYSWQLDLEILLKTFRVVFTGQGFVPDRNPAQVDDIPQSASLEATPALTAREADVFQRIEPELLGHYAKNASYEVFLNQFNAALAESHDNSLRDLPETFSTIHVIGAPRSGTTLLTQLVAGCLDVGYINNLIAAFWRTPCFGIPLSQRLLPNARPSQFVSDYGRTGAIHEPHEYGYFWSHLLGYPEMAEQGPGFEQTIDWQRLRKVLLNMAHTFDRPVVFKSFLLAWHLEQMRRILPTSIFLWIRRDRLANALSIYGARQAQLGTTTRWLSMKPKEYEWLQHESVPTQIAGQVFFTEAAIARQMERIQGQNVLEINYQDLCTNPQAVVDRVKSILEANGQDVRQVAPTPQRFEISSPRTDSLTSEIQAAFAWLEDGNWHARETYRLAG